MNIALISAMDRQQVIGLKNALPWYLPADLAHFKKLTLGKPVIMGRKTFESIGKPLPRRKNIVLSRHPIVLPADCLGAHTLLEALQHAKQDNPTEIYIIGGASLYEQTLPLADSLYLTTVEADVEGDAYFPHWDKERWVLCWEERHPQDDKNKHSCVFRKFTLHPQYREDAIRARTGILL